MIKEQVKCPKCNKVLIRGYSTAVLQVYCKCGKVIDLRKDLRKVDKSYANS